MTGTNGNLTLNIKQILLIDSETDLTSIKEYVTQKPLIITFDYASHDSLLQNSIDHKTSDDYLTESDLDDLQNQVYKFGTWYENESVVNGLQYEGVNIGRLFHEQTVDYLVKFVKKSHEVFQIYSKNKQSTFIAAGLLYQLVTNLTDSTIKITQSKKEELTFAHDRVRVNMRIGNHYLMFHISRSLYLKLKRLSEIVINLLFRSKIDDSQKTVLLVELPTNRYKELFLKSKKSGLNVVFYGRRRPAIWNYESYKIMKNSSCKIATFSSLIDSDWKNPSKIISNLEDRIKQLWQNENFFTNYFMQNGVSLWKILKPKFEGLIQDRINEIVLEIELAKNLFTKYNFNSIVVLHEIGMTEQIVVGQAKKRNIPVILLQIGHHFDTPEAKKHNVSCAVYPIDAAKFVVCGNIAERDALTNGGLPPSMVVNLGSPRYDNAIADYAVSDNDYILLATPGPGNMTIRGQVINNIENYLASIRRICEIITRNKKNLVIKPHTSADDIDIRKIVHQVNPEIQVVTTGDIMPLISSCSFMIMMGLSTSILEAQMFQKPVICMPAIDFNFGIPEPLRSKSCVTTTVDDLEKIIHQILNDENYKKSLIEKGNRYVSNYISNLNKSSEKFFEFLNSIP